MALFRRNQPNDALPEEVRTYYEAERRDRPVMAWLLAGATLLAVVLIITGLFFGGRWIYRTINKDDNKSTKTNTPSPAPSSSSSSTGTSSTSTSKPSPAPTPPTASAPTPAPTPPTAKTPPAPTPAPPSASTGKLSNTGPGDEIAIAFVTATTLGTAAHAIRSRRRS